MDTHATLERAGRDVDSTIEAIIQAVAARTDSDPTELPPLYERIDPDALEAIFSPTRTGFQRIGRVEFAYAGHEVAVSVDEDGQRTVELDAIAEPASSH